MAAHCAQRDFGVKDRGVLRAIARHTLGRGPMGRLDKILYVADFSAPDRRFAGAGRVRSLAEEDLKAAFQETVRLKRLYGKITKIQNTITKQ